MQDDISTEEFEAMITTRVHSVLLKAKSVAKESCNAGELVLKYSIAANKILTEFDIKDLKAIFRRNKAYIIFIPTGRIACEIGVDGEYKNGIVRRSRALLLSRRGYLKSRSLQSLIDYTASRGKTIYSNLTKEEVNAKRKEYYQSK